MKDRKVFWILIGGFTAALIAIVAVMTLLPGRAPIRLSSLEPRTYVTPTPDLEEFSLRTPTPAPTPIHIIQTPRPILPETAVNLIVDGTPLFALDSRETARLLIDAYFRKCAEENIDENSFLLKASVVSSLATVPADGSVEYLSYEDALAKLMKNRSYISVQRTLERVEVRLGEVEETEEKSPLLPKGAKLYRRLGAPSRTIVITEILYKDGIAYKDTETLEKQVTGGSSRSVLVGTYSAFYPDLEPGSEEGQPGKDKGTLSFRYPVRGTVTSYFGTRYGRMHYGIDITAKTDAHVVAPEEGTVVFCGERPGYGLVIDIRHENGFVSRIAGCESASVEFEEHVSAGQTVASLPENDGAKTATLHYELLIDGVPYNPMYYFD